MSMAAVGGSITLFAVGVILIIVGAMILATPNATGLNGSIGWAFIAGGAVAIISGVLMLVVMLGGGGGGSD
jgi:hypothetical protein